MWFKEWLRWLVSAIAEWMLHQWLSSITWSTVASSVIAVLIGAWSIFIRLPWPLAILIGVATFAFSLFLLNESFTLYERYKAYRLEKTRPSGENRVRLPHAKKLKSLHDLFMQDFKDTSSIHSTFTMTSSQDATVKYEAEYLVFTDFKAKILYFSFFLPDSPHTFIGCQYLPTAYQRLLESEPIKILLSSTIHQAPGEVAERGNELKPSGRLFIYHETHLVPDQLDALRQAFRGADLSPQFRGRDYLILRNSPLYDERY